MIPSEPVFLSRPPGGVLQEAVVSAVSVRSTISERLPHGHAGQYQITVTPRGCGRKIQDEGALLIRMSTGLPSGV